MQVLAESKPEDDADREEIRILLAIAKSACPALLADELVTMSCHLLPQLRRFDRELIVDVAERMTG